MEDFFIPRTQWAIFWPAFPLVVELQSSGFSCKTRGSPTKLFTWTNVVFNKEASAMRYPFWYLTVMFPISPSRLLCVYFSPACLEAPHPWETLNGLKCPFVDVLKEISPA